MVYLHVCSDQQASVLGVSIFIHVRTYMYMCMYTLVYIHVLVRVHFVFHVLAACTFLISGGRLI